MSLARAIALAADVHDRQYDKGGKPYILHPIAVMEDVLRVTDGDEDAGIIAILHDVLEDNDKYSHEFLKGRLRDEYGDTTTLSLLHLTKEKGADYMEYIRKIKALDLTEFPHVSIVKMADLRHNLNIRRQPTLDDKALLRLQRYHMAYRELRGDTND